jgi:BirA family transcriptional regulator, biotin operon repressor / biotin---[acetyl-CoA-carboxylase] ligase
LIHHLTTTDSTNTEARRHLDGGAKPPFWIIADEQTKGRGRLGRHWISEVGNLYSTYAFPLLASPSAASQISFVAALAIHDTASSFITGSNISLKWPNDCLINGSKFSGVLAELSENTMILGMGLNVLHEPQDLPYAATCLKAHASSITVAKTFENLQLKLKKWLQIWDNGQGFHHIHRGWEARCDAIGKPVSLDSGTVILHGTFAGLAPDGGLLLNHNNTTTTHHAGDVRIIATETNPA